MSQFNVDTIKGSSGSHGPIIVGVTTVSGNLHVGSAVTVYSSSGIVSATAFYGDGSELTGIAGGTTLSAGSGAQRVVVTSSTSGLMTSAATDTGLSWDSSTNTLGVTSVSATNLTGTLTGNVTGNVTGNASGTSATVTGATQASITSVGTLTAVSIDGQYKQAFDALTPATTPAIDCSLGNYFTLDASSAPYPSVGWSFTNVPASVVYSCVIKVTTGGSTTINWNNVSVNSGSYTNKIKWSGGAVPAFTATKPLYIILTTDDTGATWQGTSLIDFATV